MMDLQPHELLQRILTQGGAAKPVVFPPNSRYREIETAMLSGTDGQEIVYLRRRFVPAPERFVAIREHVFAQGERLDNVSAQHLGDPELFWQLCDANRALKPTELEQVHQRLRITLPEGIPAQPTASE